MTMIETVRRSVGTVGLLAHRRQAGQGLVEYSLILILVAMAVVGTVYGYGSAVQELYQFILDNWPTW
jgi:Flp pilus assembly pilin Flp